jgi:hypothetical protein
LEERALSRERRAVVSLVFTLAAAGVAAWALFVRDPSARGMRASEGIPAIANSGARAAPELASLLSKDTEAPVLRQALPFTAAETAGDAPASAATTRVVARFVDPRGAPLAGVELRALELELACHSAPDGSAELVLEDGRLAAGGQELAFEAHAAGYAREQRAATVRRGERLHLGVWTLVPSGAVEGRVLDANGRGVGGAEVAALRAELAQGDEAERAWSTARIGTFELVARPGVRAVSDASGAFRLEELPAGALRLVALADDRPSARSEPLELPAGGVVRGVTIELATDEGVSIAGIVLDPLGEPAPEAELHIASGGTSYTLHAGRDGRFALRRNHSGSFYVRAVDRARRYREAEQRGVAPGTRDLVLRLGLAPELALVVVGEDAAPVERFGYAVLDARAAETLWAEPEDARRDGRATIAAPAQEFWVEVRANGWMSARAGPFSGEEPPAEHELVLHPAGGLYGVVLAAGAPVAGAWVALFEPTLTHDTFNGFPLRTRKEAAREGESDADGAFALSVEKPGRYCLRVFSEGYALAEVDGLALAPDARHELAVELTAGGALAVEVRSREGASPAGKLVAVSRGDGYAFTQRTDEAGRTRFENLTPGPWQVQLSEKEIDWRGGSFHPGLRPAAPIPSNCRVLEGESTRVVLGLDDDEEERDAPCRLIARLWLDGRPAEGWVASLEPVGAEFGPPQAASEPGLFVLGAETAGRHRLTLGPEHPEPSAMQVVRDELELVLGERHWSLELALGRIEGTLAGGEPAFHRFERGSVQVFTALVPGADGRYAARVPAGRGELVAVDLGRPLAEQTPRVLRAVEVAAGETFVLDAR